MINKTILTELANLNKGNTMSMINSVVLMEKHANIQLKNTDNKLFYILEKDELYKSNIPIEVLVTLITKGGWEVNIDQENIIKHI